MNIKILKSIEFLFLKNKEKIIDLWIFSEKMSDNLLLLNMIPSDFKIKFADNMINKIMNLSSLKDELCISTLEFISKYEENKNVPKLIIVIHTDLKNILMEIIYSSDIENKLEAHNLINEIMSFHLSYLIDELFYKYKRKNNVNNEHIKILEESTVMSKTDKNGILTFVSDSFCDLVGYSREELLGSNHNIIRHPDTPSQLYKNMWEDLKNGRIWEGKFKNLSKDKRTLIINSKIIPKYNSQNELVGYVAIRTDITDKELARIDSLTGLANRLKFQEKIAEKIDEYLIHNKKHAISIIDIDHFKSVNDKYGHLVGDIILKEFVDVIKKHIRRDDLFARWGGEEFVLVLSIGDFDLTLNKLKEIKDSINNYSFTDIGNLTASFGLIEISEEYLTSNKLLEKADECLYIAKNNGRNRICYIDPKTKKICEKI